MQFRRTAALALVVTLCALSGSAVAKPQPETTHGNPHAVCAQPASEHAECGVLVDAKPTSGTVNAPLDPSAYGPAQFHGAYNVPATAATPVTIALIEANDNPNAKADLDVYNQTMRLPAFPTCSASVTVSCFQKVTQKSKMFTSESWIVESSLDVQTAHQMCQNCKILLVEAASSSMSDLLWGVDQAVALGAQVVSMSWGRTETTTSYDAHFSKPGIAFVASTGDAGYGGSHYPASSQYVAAVGGTTLSVNADNSWAGESAWASGGSGCSPYEPKPDFQPATGCANRAYADVAADADYSASGAAVYDSFGINGTTGWLKVGGTSLAAPLVAGMYGLTGMTSGSARLNALPYRAAGTAALHDITSGANGTCGTLLCTAGAGYDGPTGVGSPNGLDALR